MHAASKLPLTSAADLSDRWRRARVSALRRIAPESPAETPEAALIPLVIARDLEGAERAVFEVSLALGRSFQRWSRTDLTLPDLAGLLPALGAPCLEQGFSRVPGELSCRSARAACDTPGACSYWREALHGLVSGLSSAVRYTRVASGAHGGQCADLLHVDALSPHRLAPVPEALQPTLDRVAQKLERVVPGARVVWLGLQDGALLVETHQPASGCGLNIDQLLLGSLRRALPDLPVKNATPRPVLTDHA